MCQTSFFSYFFAMIEQEQNRKKNRFAFLLLPSIFIALLWAVYGVEQAFGLDFAAYAVEPRTQSGILGILFFPLIHGGIEHLAGNTSSLFVLMVGVRYIFPNLFLKVFTWSYFAPGIFVWIFGRPSFHLGASGMIYALAVFMFITGVIRSNRYLLTISLLVVFLYGSMFWGIFPLEKGISWEGHLGGAITGFLLAMYYINVEPVEEVREKEHVWDDDEPEFDDWKMEDEPDDNGPKTIVYHFKPRKPKNENQPD